LQIALLAGRTLLYFPQEYMHSRTKLMCLACSWANSWQLFKPRRQWTSISHVWEEV